jgi:hypothetical protein
MNYNNNKYPFKCPYQDCGYLWYGRRRVNTNKTRQAPKKCPKCYRKVYPGLGLTGDGIRLVYRMLRTKERYRERILMTKELNIKYKERMKL